jgi:hypothetical protein
MHAAAPDQAAHRELEPALRSAVVELVEERLPGHAQLVHRVDLYVERVKTRLAQLPSRFQWVLFERLVEEPDLASRRKLAEAVAASVGLENRFGQEILSEIESKALRDRQKLFLTGPGGETAE